MKSPLRAVLIIFLLAFLSHLTVAQGRKKPRKPAKAQPAVVEENAAFVPVDALVQQEVTSQGITGAVLLVGHDGKIVHEKAFGLRAASPRPDRMTVDTVFDLASLTKVIATS